MGGGLFGTPLYLNTKCILFAFFLIFVYYLPHPSSWNNQVIMVFLLATSGYILLAWYDFLYSCNDRLGPTVFGWMSKFLKPKPYSVQFDKLPLKYKKSVRMFDITVLILLAITFVYPFYA